jgi:hypothetical protein
VAPPPPEQTAGVPDVAAPNFVQVSATALRTGHWWTVSLVGSEDISVKVRRLRTADEAMSKALARALARDAIDVRVHIRWYDAAAATN